MCLQRAANTPACLCWQLPPLVFLWIEVCMKKKKSLDCAAKPLVVPISKQVRRVISVADRRACFNRIHRLSLIALISVKLPEWQLNRHPCWGTFVEAVELECKEVSWILRFHLLIVFILSQPIRCVATSSARSFRPTTWVLGSFSCALRPGG